MLHKEKNISIHRIIILLLIVLSVLFLKIGFIHNYNWYWGLLFTMPLMLITIVRQLKQQVTQNHLVTSHLRYLLNDPKRAGHMIRLGITQLFQKVLSPGNH